MGSTAKLTIKWFLIGLAIYAAWGVIGYFWFDAAAMKEPPPYFAAAMTLLVVVQAAVREAVAVGSARRVANPDAEPDAAPDTGRG